MPWSSLQALPKQAQENASGLRLPPQVYALKCSQVSGRRDRQYSFPDWVQRSPLLQRWRTTCMLRVFHVLGQAVVQYPQVRIRRPLSLQGLERFWRACMACFKRALGLRDCDYDGRPITVACCAATLQSLRAKINTKHKIPQEAPSTSAMDPGTATADIPRLAPQGASIGLDAADEKLHGKEGVMNPRGCYGKLFWIKRHWIARLSPSISLLSQLEPQ